MLKNTNLASPFLFGDIPEYLSKKYDLSQTSRDAYMLRPMASSAKRTSSPSVAPRAKRSSNYSSRPHASSSLKFESNLGKDNFHRPPRAHTQTKSRARHRGGKGGRR